MMKKVLLFVAVAAILTGCAQSVRIYSDLEDTASFESYQTYTFLDFTDGNKKTITGMELERIRVAFAREIEQKGLSFSEDSPDLTVQITVYHREALDRVIIMHLPGLIWNVLFQWIFLIPIQRNMFGIVLQLVS